MIPGHPVCTRLVKYSPQTVLQGASCKTSTALLDKEASSGAFSSAPTLQGLFFDDSYGFYPGQVLIGPAKIFSSVQWLSGVKPVLSTKSKFRVVVEEVRV